MSDGDYQREGISNRVYLPFTFENEVIEPEQYLDWHHLKEEYEIELYLKEYESNSN